MRTSSCIPYSIRRLSLGACIADATSTNPLRNYKVNDKRQALVTGANKGIGLAIAQGLAEAGFRMDWRS